MASLVSSDFGWGFGEDLDLCDVCETVKWGAFTTLVSFSEGSDTQVPPTPDGLQAVVDGPYEQYEWPDITTVAILGWWIAGDIPAVGQLPITGGATYAGDTIATVATDLFTDGDWITYVATGDVAMNWNFGKRTGDMTVSNFDASHFKGGLTFSGKMCAPGVTSCGSTPGGQWRTPAGNHFGGPLKGELPGNWYNGEASGQVPVNARNLDGFALGSFVRGPTNYQLVDGVPVPINRSVPQGIIGNWAVGGERYTASGVFGASRN